MAKKKAARKKNPTHRAAKRRSNPRRRNPVHRRRNGGSLGAGRAVSNLKQGFWALVGLVVTRQAAQTVLGSKNTGVMGYLANIVAAFGISMVVTKFAGAPAGDAAGIGGGLYLANRVLNDNFSPIGKVLSLSGLGDAGALGEIASEARSYFPLPVAYNNQREPIIPTQIRAVPPQPMPMPGTPPASTMGRMWGRRGRG